MNGIKGKMRRLCFSGFVFALLFLIVVFVNCNSEGHSRHKRKTAQQNGNNDNTGDTFPFYAKHIILFIGDGMQLEYEVAESRYLYGADFQLSWNKFPYRAYVATWDIDTYNAYAPGLGKAPYNETTFDPMVGYDPAKGGTAPYPIDKTGDQSYLLVSATDSASAATAIATGVKTDHGNISWLSGDPPNGAIETIAEKMRAQKSASMGVVSTVPFDHATPAAFVSHNPDRNDFTGMADEIIHATKPEVVIGGGHPNWCGYTYITEPQLDELRTSSEYVLVERVDGQDGGANLLNAANLLSPDKKLFGLFGGSGSNFDSPVPADNHGNPGFTVNDEDPTLAEATEAALTVLSRNTHGFFLMVESGAIDWANHGNNYTVMIGEMWSLEEAVKAAEAFVDRPGDDVDWNNTIIIVTADHATGGMRLTDSPILGKGELPHGGEMTYATGGHTNELVTLYINRSFTHEFKQLEGTWYNGAKILDNTQLFDAMAEAANLQ